jgi:WD40 repeat protein
VLAWAFLLAAFSIADEPQTKSEATRVPVTRTIEIGSKVLDIQLSKDGKSLVIGSAGSVGIMHELDRSEAIEFKGHEDSVTRMAISPDQNLVVTGSDDQTIRVWKMPDAKQFTVIKGHTAAVTGLAFSPDGKVLVSGDSKGNILFHEADSGTLLGKVERLGEGLTRLAFSPDGKYVAASLATGQVAFVEPDAPYRLILTQAKHSAKIRGLAVSPDSKSVVAADEDGLVQVYDPVSGKAVRDFKVEGGAAGLAFSSDGKLLAVGGWDKGRLHIVDWATTRVVAQWEGHGSSNAQYGVAFSPDGSRLYSGSGDGTVKVWKLENLAKPK